MNKSTELKLKELFAPLSPDEKVEMISRLMAHLKKDLKSNPNDRKVLIEQLFEAWDEFDDQLDDDKPSPPSNHGFDFRLDGLII